MKKLLCGVTQNTIYTSGSRVVYMWLVELHRIENIYKARAPGQKNGNCYYYNKLIFYLGKNAYQKELMKAVEDSFEKHFGQYE